MLKKIFCLVTTLVFLLLLGIALVISPKNCHIEILALFFMAVICAITVAYYLKHHK